MSTQLESASVAAGSTDPTWRPLAAAAITMVLWASAFVVIRAVGPHVGPGSLALGRLAVAALVLTVMALGPLRRGRRIALPRGRALALVIAYGLLWFGLYFIAVNAAGRLLDAGTSAMLVNLGPIILAVLAAVFLREGFPRGLVLGLLVAFAGVVTIAFGSTTGRISALGIAFSLAAAALYAVGVLLQKQALRPLDAVTVTWFGSLVGLAATLPFAPALVAELTVAPVSATLGVVYLGVFPTAIAFSLWAYALSYSTAGRLGASTYLVPGLAVLMSWVFLGEVPVPLALIGGAISLVGVALTRLVPDQRRDRV